MSFSRGGDIYIAVLFKFNLLHLKVCEASLQWGYKSKTPHQFFITWRIFCIGSAETHCFSIPVRDSSNETHLENHRSLLKNLLDTPCAIVDFMQIYQKCGMDWPFCERVLIYQLIKPAILYIYHVLYFEKTSILSYLII